MLHMKIDTRRTIASLPLLLCSCSSPRGCAAPPEEAPAAGTATVFEGARLIIGDGSDPIENSTFIVDGDSFVAVGATGEVEVPEGAATVDLGGRTVIPALIDTHVHFSIEREGAHRGPAAEGLLRGRRGHGSRAGRRRGRVPGPGGDHPRRTALPARRPGDHDPGARTHGHSPIGSRPRRRRGRRCGSSPRLEVDIVKIWVDDRGGQFEKMTPRSCIPRSSTRRTSTGCGSPPTSSPWRTPRACCVRGSTRSPTASATRTSTTSFVELVRERPGRRARAEPGGPRRRRGPGLAGRDHPAR